MNVIAESQKGSEFGESLVHPTCSKQNQLEQVYEGPAQLHFKYPRRWKPLNLSGQPVPVFDHPHSKSEWGKQRGRITSLNLLAAFFPLQSQLGIGMCLIWCPPEFPGPFLQSFFLESWTVHLCLGLLLSRCGPCTTDQNCGPQHQPLRYVTSGQPLIGLHSANNSPLDLAIYSVFNPSYCLFF